MSKPTKKSSELVQAAEALENEMDRLEALSKSVQSNRLDSEKSISRAARELGEALELPERLGPELQAFAEAMQRLQERQRAALEPLAAFAARVRDRRARLDEHMKAFAALGESAGKASARLQSSNDAPATLDALKTELGRIAGEARALFESARSDDFPDVAREADALSKRLLALRQRVEAVRPSGN